MTFGEGVNHVPRAVELIPSYYPDRAVYPVELWSHRDSGMDNLSLSSANVWHQEQLYEHLHNLGRFTRR